MRGAKAFIAAAVAAALLPGAAFAGEGGLQPRIPQGGCVQPGEIHVQNQSVEDEFNAAYEAVVDEWRDRIRAEGASASTRSWHYTKGAYVIGATWRVEQDALEGFCYAFADVGGSDVPALLIGDPADGYMVWSIYLYDPTAGEVGQWQGEPSYSETMTYREGGFFFYETHGGTLLPGSPWHLYAQVQKPAGFTGSSYYELPLLSLADVEKVSHADDAVARSEGVAPGSGDYQDSSGAVTRVSDAMGAIARLKERYPLDASLVWRPILDGYVAPGPAGGESKMSRLYNPYSGEHFYTASETERDMLMGLGWEYEGVGWTAPESSDTPVYRVYNPYAGEHHYTMDSAERDALIAAGWDDEGIGWYSDDAKATPLYRDYNPYEFANNHNYTADEAEHDSLVSAGWHAEGYAWYGVAGGGAAASSSAEDASEQTVSVQGYLSRVTLPESVMSRIRFDTSESGRVVASVDGVSAFEVGTRESRSQYEDERKRRIYSLGLANDGSQVFEAQLVAYYSNAEGTRAAHWMDKSGTELVIDKLLGLTVEELVAGVELRDAGSDDAADDRGSEIKWKAPDEFALIADAAN